MMLLEIIENTPGVAKAEQRSLSKALASREGRGLTAQQQRLGERSLALSRTPREEAWTPGENWS